MLEWIGAFLALRCVVLKKKALALFFALISGVLFLTLPFSFDIRVLLPAALLIGVSGYLNTQLKQAFCLCFCVLALGAISLAGFNHLSEEKPLAKVTLTGKTSQRWMEWKAAHGPVRTEWVTVYEVILENSAGEEIGRYEVCGDVVGVRAQVFRFHKVLNFLGIPQVGCLDSVFGGYMKMEEHNLLPHVGYSLPLPSPLFSFFWKHYFYASSWLIQNTLLEAEYFPLVSPQGEPVQASFYLTLNGSGLSSQKALRADTTTIPLQAR